MNISLIFGVLEQGLKLWNSKESTKYLDRTIKLRREYYEELKRPFNDRSQLTLDNILLELEGIAENFIKYNRTK